MDPNIAKPEIEEQPSEQGTGRPLDESKKKERQATIKDEENERQGTIKDEEKERQATIKDEEKKRQATIKDEIFQASMGNKWTEVQRLYNNNEFVRESKLTKSEDTALHIAISSYHPDRDDSLQDHLNCIKKMVATIPQRNRFRILKQKNEEGNTPLHLAAELGIVPIIECLVNPEDRTLIRETNSKGETPLFITAYQGKLNAFLYLHKCVQDEKEEGRIELCRRKDGDNILHAAISGEYFEVAFQIIRYYPLLVNRYNTKGMSPLHFLSRMPRVFRSGSQFRFLDSIIYYCINIEPMKYEDSNRGRCLHVRENYQTVMELKLLVNKIRVTAQATNANPEEESPGHQNDPKNPPTQAEGKRNGKLFPANYTILIEFLKCLMKIVLIVLGIDYIIGVCTGNRENKSKDPTNVNQDKMSQGHQSDRQYDPENPTIKDITRATNDNQENKSPNTTGATNENQEKKSPAEGKRLWNFDGKLFPPNYTIFIEFLKCLMKIVLIVLGIGLQRIKKLEERKKKHTRGVQIMKLMIEKEERYKFYQSTGGKPEVREPEHSPVLLPPATPPQTEDDNKKGHEKKKDDHTSELSKPTKETPLLVASRMGIVEMVQKILKKFPIAIQDTDSEEKNLLLLAVEHRQTEIYNWLIGEKYPEYVFYQVDKEGNNAVHLAARHQKHEVWRIPGAALQLQGERKWYKYVKHTLPPQSYVRYNEKGQTPKQVFIETHAKLLKDGTDWLVTTANSFSVVAALIATVAFATSSQIPGGPNESGHPQFENQPAFNVFSISSLVSLCFSVTALVFFLAILTSRCQHNDFEKDLPRKLLLGLTSLFASITAILISFCAAHFFVLLDNFKNAAFPIYAATCIPVVLFALNQFPLYVDLIRSYIKQWPLRSYKVFYTDSSVADQKKEGKEKEE